MAKKKTKKTMKKSKEEKKEKKSDFFVQIEDATSFRRELLEASKKSINLLKQIKEIKRMRERKAELFIRLDSVFAEIKKLDEKLIEFMPKTSIRITKNKTNQPPKNLKNISELKLKDLDNRLAEIEGKINSLY